MEYVLKMNLDQDVPRLPEQTKTFKKSVMPSFLIVVEQSRSWRNWLEPSKVHANDFWLKIWRRVAAKLVPRVLSDEQGANRLHVSHELKEKSEIDPNFWSKVITDDQSWCNGYGLQTKQQSSRWKDCFNTKTKIKKPSQVKSNVTTMLVYFFNTKGFNRHEFFPQG